MLITYILFAVPQVLLLFQAQEEKVFRAREMTGRRFSPLVVDGSVQQRSSVTVGCNGDSAVAIQYSAVTQLVTKWEVKNYAPVTTRWFRSNTIVQVLVNVYITITIIPLLMLKPYCNNHFIFALSVLNNKA